MCRWWAPLSLTRWCSYSSAATTSRLPPPTLLHHSSASLGLSQSTPTLCSSHKLHRDRPFFILSVDILWDRDLDTRRQKELVHIFIQWWSIYVYFLFNNKGWRCICIALLSLTLVDSSHTVFFKQFFYKKYCFLWCYHSKNGC